MTRLYKYRITGSPKSIDFEKWSAFAAEKWRDADKPFFLPDEEKVFRSRSSAQERVNIAARWGFDAEVLECDPVWVECREAARRRKAERDVNRAAKLRDKANELERRSMGAAF